MHELTRKVALCFVVAALLATSGGCLAISAKEVSAELRHEAVATIDGRIFVVDTKTLTAREVRVVHSLDDSEWHERDDDWEEDDD